MAKRKTANSTPAGATFNGGGHFPGVPARDLTPDEWAAMTDDQRAALLRSGLYTEAAAIEEPAGENDE